MHMIRIASKKEDYVEYENAHLSECNRASYMHIRSEFHSNNLQNFVSNVET